MIKDNECPLCSELLANNYDCPQCGWAVSDPESNTAFRQSVRRMRRQMHALSQYPEPMEESFI